MAKSSDSYNDLYELGIEHETEDELAALFTKAANHLPTLLPNVDNTTLASLYGYYKQAVEGPCKAPKPSWYDMKGKAKWEAWNNLEKMPKEEAMLAYIQIIKNLDKDFSLPDKTPKKEFWVSVSTLQPQNDEINESERSLIDFIKESDYNLVVNAFTTYDQNKLKSVLNELDDEGLGLIHWAADRGSEEILKLLIDEGADINLPDSDNQTSLHYAASCGHINCVKLLMDKGANVDIKDVNGDTPLMVCNDEATKLLFKK